MDTLSLLAGFPVVGYAFGYKSNGKILLLNMIRYIFIKAVRTRMTVCFDDPALDDPIFFTLDSSSLLIIIQMNVVYLMFIGSYR